MQESLRRELLTAIEVLKKEVMTSLEMHERTHAEEDRRRESRIRWTVTSILSGVGLLVSLYIGIRY